MSLDISVTNTRTEETREMNWLRNPYGLERWARANYCYVKKSEPTPNLWDVINQWNYDKGDKIDKPLFLSIVQQYGAVILTLEKGYFWFNVQAFLDFILPHLHHFPTHDFGNRAMRIDGNVFNLDHIGLPMEYFSNPCFELSSHHRPSAHTLERYQNWYRELIAFAELLQDPESVFYCSN